MTTPTTPPTPDRLREILARHLKVCADEDFGAWREIQDMGPFERDLRALIASERKDARRLEREQCALYVTNEGLASLGKEIRALPDEEPP